MRFQNHLDQILGEVVKGFGLAIGVALAKALTVIVPLTGFNLNF